MSKQETTTQEGIADITADAYRLGVDDHGDVHYHSPMRKRIWVVSDGTIAHIQDLSEKKDAVTWKRFIAQDRGWNTVQAIEKRGGVAELLETVLTRAGAA